MLVRCCRFPTGARELVTKRQPIYQYVGTGVSQLCKISRHAILLYCRFQLAPARKGANTYSWLRWLHSTQPRWKVQFVLETQSHFFA
jgi:hypothetical protein